MAIWEQYRRLSKMPLVPEGSELEDAQQSIDNRAEAILKVRAFLGTGLAVLTKLVDTPVSTVLGVTVVLLSGFSLGGALLAQNPLFSLMAVISSLVGG